MKQDMIRLYSIKTEKPRRLCRHCTYRAVSQIVSGGMVLQKPCRQGAVKVPCGCVGLSVASVEASVVSIEAPVVSVEAPVVGKWLLFRTLMPSCRCREAFKLGESRQQTTLRAYAKHFTRLRKTPYAPTQNSALSPGIAVLHAAHPQKGAGWRQGYGMVLGKHSRHYRLGYQDDMPKSARSARFFLF